MSYVVSFQPFVIKGWYENAFMTLLREMRARNQQTPKSPLHEMDKLFEAWEKHYHSRIICDSSGFAIGVEFPTEEDATLFLLRWS